jgi:hypothetical protein
MVVEKWDCWMQSITLKVVFSSLTSLLFYEGYISIEGREDYFSCWCVVHEEEKDESFVKAFRRGRRKTNSDESVVRDSI